MHAIEAARREPVTVAPGATVTQAAELMDRAAVGALVVVEADGRPVGIVTDRDLVVRALAHRCDPEARVDSAMSTDLVTLPASADLREALELFERHPVRRLPLMDGDRMVGMLTMDDLVVDLVSDLGRLTRPILGQVLFGHPEPVTPVPTR
ncbi:MAG TPA: CBS domain-containing protein [Acidimicrobiales bacterium]